jgi:hypothetical protein
VRGGSGTTTRSHGREKAEEKREKRLVSNLTPLRSSCGGLRRGRSGGATARRAAEARQWWAAEKIGALGLFGRDTAAAAWGKELGHGGLNRAVHGALACGLGAPRGAERRCTSAGLGLESESSAGREKAPTGGTRSPERELGRGEEVGRTEESGPRRAAGLRGEEGKVEKGAGGLLGRKEGKAGRTGSGCAGGGGG